MVLKRLGLAIGLLIGTLSVANAQCTGNFTSGDVCANSTTATAPPTRTHVTKLLSRGQGVKTIYANDPAYGVVCDGSTNNDAALALISTAVATGGYEVVLPNTGLSCKYTTWTLNALTNIRIRGGTGFSNNSSAVGTALECTRTDAGTCLTWTTLKGLTVNYITFIKADAHTGRVIDLSSASSTWNKISFDHVEFKRASGTNRNGTLVYLRNTVDTSFNVVRFSHAANALVGGDNGETTTGSAVVTCSSCDFVDVTVAVRNPGPFWTYFSGAWEQTLTGAPVTLVSQAADTVKAIGFYGVTFADPTAAGTWMTFSGGVWGFTMQGGSMAGVVGVNGLLFAGAGAGTQGVNIHGVNFAGLDTAITLNGTCSGPDISGNVYTSVTTRITNVSSACYVEDNAPLGSLYVGQGTYPLWTTSPVISGTLSVNNSQNNQTNLNVTNTNAGASAKAALQATTNAGSYEAVAASTAGGAGFGNTWSGSGGYSINVANATGNFNINMGVGFTNRFSVSNAGVVNIPGSLTVTTPIVRGSGGTGTSTGAVVKVVLQKFTAGGTYTPTTGLLYAIVKCTGSGGGGGSAAGTVGNIYGGAGGGSGGTSEVVLSAATIGASQTVTIGAAGAGGAAGSNNGAAGADVSLGTLCIGKGGAGGGFSAAAQNGPPGVGGVAGTGDVTGTGMPGGPGFYNSVNNTIANASGFGGSSRFGGGGVGVNVNAAGTAAGNYGSGGGGAYAVSTASTFAGGNGSAGIVVITEFVNQ